MANRIQRFLQGLVGAKSIQTPDRKAGYLSFDGDSSILGTDMNQEMYLKSYKSWVYAAVTKRADSFSNLKLTLNKIVKKNGKQEIQPVKNHAVLELLDRVNPYLSFPDLLKIHQTYKDLAGNAYWWLIKSGNTITEIWPYLRPDRMSAIPSSTDFISGYNYLVPGKGEYVKFSKEEIIHFKYPNPLDPYHGVSPMEASYLAFNTYMKSSEFNNRFFANNARADFLLTFPEGLTESETKQIRAQWETRHKGRGHEHRFAIVSGDAKVQNLGINAKDMEFIEQMKFTRDEILAIFKVPKALLDPQELNYASAQVAKEVFMEEVIVPLMKDFVTQLNEFLLPNYGDDSLFFDFEMPMEENPDERNKWIASRIAAGSISPNEIRALDNLPPFPGGENIYLSGLMQPIGQEDTQQGKILLGKVEKVQLPKKHNVLIKSRSEIAELREAVKEDIKKGLSKDIINKKQKVMPPEKKKKSERQIYGEMAWRAKIVKTNEHEREMRRRLQVEFNRQERNVINSLREKSFSFSFDEEKEAGIFVQTFNPFYADLVKAFGEDALDMVNMSGFEFSDRVKQWLKTNVLKFATEVNSTTKDKITKALIQAVENGEGIQDAAKRIRAVFTEANMSRGRMIARTEISRASNYATVEGWKQSDVVEQKEWFTALDERVDGECADLDGTIVTLDGKFGTNDTVFGNVEEPPLHINCRCRLLPVLKTKATIISELKSQKNELEKTVVDIKEKGEKEIEEIRVIKDKLNKVLEDGEA